MNKNDWEITVADFPDREEPVCEIWYRNQHWVDVSEEVRNKCMVAFYSKEDGEYWEFPYEEALEVLQEAKEHLAKLQRTPEEQAEYEAKIEEQQKKYYE